MTEFVWIEGRVLVCEDACLYRFVTNGEEFCLGLKLAVRLDSSIKQRNGDVTFIYDHSFALFQRPSR